MPVTFLSSFISCRRSGLSEQERIRSVFVSRELILRVIVVDGTRAAAPSLPR